VNLTKKGVSLKFSFIFILSLKLKYNQCLIIFNLFRNEVKKKFKMSDAISKRNCTCFKGWRQFYFKIALLSWAEQIHFITWSPNTLGNKFFGSHLWWETRITMSAQWWHTKIAFKSWLYNILHEEHIRTKFLIISVVLRFWNI
jgi:hypothetical protein